MGRKIFAFVLSIILSAVLTAGAFAEDVYVTKSGKKYHKAGSRFIKDKDVDKMSREEAEELGYEPSKDFLRDDIQTSDTQKKDK